ncbi:MAG: UDP-N-acetylglucosamine pyrophosphorylase [Lachnospiraceae bacterium]|nr:UDP-N-acetylglucosamine pyrophosphorylase [Lachnospiraceae bacterium]
MIEEALIKNLYDLNETMAASFLGGFTYPWEALNGIGEMIIGLIPALDHSIYEERREYGENVWIARSAVVYPSACIKGPCIIGERSEVRHSAFIRGKALVGNYCTVGNSTELKNVILFNHVQVPHFNYVGDSILGYYSHMGAGAIASNVKADKKNIVIKMGDEAVETGLKKIGALLGDYVEVGCNSVLNPGTVVGRHTNIYATSNVRGIIPPDSIFKDQSNIVKKC